MNHSSETTRKYKTPAAQIFKLVHASREKLKRTLKSLSTKFKQLEVELAKTKAKVELQLKQIAAASSKQPTGEQASLGTRLAPMAGHQYPAQLIALGCTLAKIVGLRATSKVLRAVNDMLDLGLRIPTRDAIRKWVCRNGVAILKAAQHHDDWIWMIDHSVQLGTMSVLVVLGIRSRNVPKDRALCYGDMTPLAVLPSHCKNVATVTQQLHSVAEKLGVPISVHCDGASELREAANALKSIGFRGPIIDDMKHKLAGCLKRMLSKNPAFVEFESRLGKCVNLIRQTELEHLLPPSKKAKCRFMNLDRIVDWALMVQCQLVQEDATDRMREKMGWINEFATDIDAWRECRELIGITLKFTNEQGLFSGSTAQLTKLLNKVSVQSGSAKAMLDAIIEIYQSNEQKLMSMPDAPPKLPFSTEVLESAFGMYKTFLRGNQRGCFTSLLASFASIFEDCTAAKIRTRFAEVKSKTLTDWLAQAGLCNSTHMRRTKAYKRAKAMQKRTKTCARPSESCHHPSFTPGY